MNNSWRLLLGVTALGLFATLAPAADPGLPVAYEEVPRGDCGCEPTRRGGFLGGVGLYLVQPYFESGLAYAVEAENQNPPRGTPTFHIVDRVDVSHHLEVAPLVWLGYLGEGGLGGRGRYWYFREGTSQALAFPASTGPTLVTVFSATPLGLEAFGDTLFQPNQNEPGVAEPTAIAITSKLEVQVGDLEALQKVRAGHWEFLFSGGARIARVAQSYQFYNLQPAAAPPVMRALFSSYNFQGAGPVLAVEARRPFGDSGLAWYSSARGALLFGSAQQNVTLGGNILRNDDPNPQFASEHRDRALPIGELEVGLDYGRCLGSSRVFGQVALVGQNWLGAGSASRSAQHSFPEGAGGGGGTAVDSDIAFFGLSFRLGVNF